MYVGEGVVHVGRGEEGVECMCVREGVRCMGRARV